MRYAPPFRLRPRPCGARAKGDPAASSGTRPRAKPRAYKANVGVRVAGALLDVLIPALFPGLVFLIGGYWQLAAIVVGLYLLLRDGLGIEPLEYTSIGKRIVGLHAEDAASGKSKLSLAISAKRNITLAAGLFLMPVLAYVAPLPLAVLVAIAGPIFELIQVLQDPDGLRQGDRMAGTKVLD